MSHARFNDAQMDQVTVQDYETMAHADFTGSSQYSVQYINCNFEDAILSDQMAQDLQARQNAQQAASPATQQVQTNHQSQNEALQMETEEPVGCMVMSM